MADATDPDTYLDTICYPVERYLLGFAQQIDDFCQWYGKKENLRYFAKTGFQLPKYILWGPGERKQQKWDQLATTILADRFGMLVAVLYLEKGIDAVMEFLHKHHFFKEIDKLAGHMAAGDAR